jgi:hypothetical protein
VKILKPILWILLGVAVATTAIGSPRSVQAQQASSEHRLKWIVVRGNFEASRQVSGHFIHDTVSKGCWLVVEPAGGERLLAPAPESACNQ